MARMGRKSHGPLGAARPVGLGGDFISLSGEYS